MEPTIFFQTIAPGGESPQGCIPALSVAPAFCPSLVEAIMTLGHDGAIEEKPDKA